MWITVGRSGQNLPIGKFDYSYLLRAIDLVVKLSKLVVVQHPPPSHHVDHTFLFQITERDVLNYFQLPGDMKALHCPRSLRYDVDGRKMTERLSLHISVTNAVACHDRRVSFLLTSTTTLPASKSLLFK